MFDPIFSWSCPHDPVALLSVDHLRAQDVVPHYFGLGFIQVKLDQEWRVHFWTPDWPTIPGAESELHDHRYGFTSWVLKGALAHEVFSIDSPQKKPGPGALELLKVTCAPGTEDIPMAQGFVLPRLIGSFTVPSGCSYQLSEDAFHRARPVGPTVTLLRRDLSNGIRTYARVLRPVGGAFTCPFSLDTSPPACWAKIQEILSA